MTPNLTDKSPRLSDAELDALAHTQQGLSGDFSQGLRSGVLDVSGKLNKAAGTVMDAAGFDGSGRHAASLRDQGLAQEAGQGLMQRHDVNDLSSGLRYLAGTAGSMVPMAGAAVGAGLLTGGRALPALAAGTAVQFPVELGGQLQRQDADPANNFATPADRLRAAGPAAAVSSAVQNIIPAGVAARMMGKAGAQSLGRVLVRGAADVPANAVASAAGEGIRQVGDNQLNPNAGYNTEAIKEAGIEGGVAGGMFGAVGAAGHALHSSGAAIKAAPGKAFEAAKGLVPEGVQKRLESAADGAGDVATTVADWAKGTINSRVADVKAWGAEFMADETVPDSLKAKVQDALNNPGDTVKQAWLATEKFTRDAAATAKAAADEADVPSRLRALHKSFKDKAGALMDKMADGTETADPAALNAAGDDIGAQRKVFDEADQTAFGKAKQWAEELSKEQLGPEKTAQLKAAMVDLTDKVNQQAVAALQRGQEAVKGVGEAINKFHAGVVKKSDEQMAGGAKKSEDYSGARRVIGDAVRDVLGPDHPAFANAKSINKLADGLRPFIEQVAAGHALDSMAKLDHLNALFDVTGDQTSAVLKAVHSAVSGAGKADKALFATLNQIEAIRTGKQSVLETLAKNLRPELQDAARPSELKLEAKTLEAWARSKSDDPAQAEKMKFNDAQMKAALEHRYGDKSELVMKAVEANMKKEENILNSGRTESKGESDDIEVKEKLARKGSRETSGDDETTKVKYFPQKDQLYLHPDYDKGGMDKKGVKYEGAATQRIKTAQKENPDASVQFRRASELGLDDPRVKAKHADLHDAAQADGMSPEEATAHADKMIERFGLVTAEAAKHETVITSGDIDKFRLDTKKYGESKSRIDIGDHIVDAVKLTEFMDHKLSSREDYTAADNADGTARKVRMFMEGVASLQAHLGKTFEIAPETIISKDGLTWGQAERRMKSGELKMADHKPIGSEPMDLSSMERQLAAKRKQYQKAVDEGWSAEIIASLKAHGVELALAVEKAQQAEHLSRFMADRGLQQADPRGPITHLGDDGEDGMKHTLRTDERGDSLKKPRGKLEGPPDPKAVAAKQAAFVEKARSGDEATKAAIAASTDSKGLQRAVEHLNTLKDAGGEKVADMIANINGRLAELVQDPNVAYGLQTKRYSLMSTQVHDDLGRPGFAATHDSPIKHGGVFDWRTHAMKGEGAMVKGAGTYLSTSDAVHGYYKKMFAKDEVSPTYHVSVDIAPEKLLNWDKPMSGQSEHVQDALYKAFGEHEINPDDLGRGQLSGGDLYRELSQSLGSDRDASEKLQSLGVLGHEMKASAKDGREHPNYVIYDDSKIHTNYVHMSQERVDPDAAGPVNRKAVLDYIGKVLGPDVSAAWTYMLHAGEFDRTAIGDVIRLSVHSLNPMSVAYHESLHGFMARLRDAKQGDIAAVLERAGESAPVLNQLKKLLANEPDALKQLTDPEERAAYMYQFWAQGKLNVGSKVEGVFQRIAEFLRKITGLMTNDERALQIMEYFHSGEYEATRSDPNAVHSALMESGAAGAVAKLKTMTKPLQEIGEALASAGGARLRDTGIPALRELADSMKLKHTTEGSDPGFLPTSRAERSRMMNDLSRDLKPYGEGVLAEALEQLQTGVKAPSLAGRVAAKIVSTRLADMLTYMKDAGVNIDALDMKDGVPYFPRSWDASYISSHQRQFKAMLDKYVASGELKGDPNKVMQKLMVTDGAEFTVEVDKPGMQNSKKRILSFISHEDAAQFMRKDLYNIMNSYVTQATRRAEWARRFGDDGAGVKNLLEQAATQGATKEQLDAAAKFVRAVDGTLGDTINPTTRRMMGNMIVYQNLRLLPLAIFSSAVDSQGIIVRGGTVGDAFKTFTRGIKEMVKNFQKDPQSDGMTQLAEAIGTIDSAMLMHTLGASYSQGMVGDKGRAFNDTFFRLNLMEQYNASMRVGATEAAMNFLVRHATQPGQHSVRFLRELGLDATDVQVGPTGRPKIFEHEGLTLEHSAKMKAAINRWVDGAILRPDAVDKAIWMSDPHYALVAHLKQFVFSFHETILKRVVHEAKNGNYAPGVALASYVPMMIAADAIKGMIMGGGSQPSWKDNWGPSDYVWNGMERAGLFGVGQFGIDVASGVRNGGAFGGFGALSGPTLEQFGDAAQVMGGREHFNQFVTKSLPANALYASALKVEPGDPKFAD